ncbi:hypothetical protein, partial [Hydrogenibacillus schlegelii]|uniref:hypothetical protein n=1 Tax=Hydrogenibacillus schlegelii TaxID=1484 RepID=UPI00349FD7D5
NLLGLPASAWAGQAMGRSLLAPTPSYAVLPGGDYAEPAFIDPTEFGRRFRPGPKRRFGWRISSI